MVCRFQSHRVTLRNGTVEWADNAPEIPLEIDQTSSGMAIVSTYAELATKEQGASLTRYFVSAGVDNAFMIPVIDRLVQAVTLANGTKRLPSELFCQADAGDDACANPRELLASVRMDTIIWIERKPTRYRTLSETRPASSPSTRAIQGDRAAPMNPVVHFYPTTGGKTFVASPVGAPEGLHEVRLQRTTAIYH